MKTSQMLLQEELTALLKETKKCFLTPSAQEYTLLDQHFRRFESLAREELQAEIQAQYPRLVQKLSNGDSLSAQEIEAVKMLIIGDARFYMKHEEDFNQWVRELGELIQQMEQSMAAPGSDSKEALLTLQGFCREARGLFINILFYLEEKERIQRFESTLQEGQLPPQAAQTLAVIIQDMLTSNRI